MSNRIRDILTRKINLLNKKLYEKNFNDRNWIENGEIFTFGTQYRGGGLQEVIIV